MLMDAVVDGLAWKANTAMNMCSDSRGVEDESTDGCGTEAAGR